MRISRIVATSSVLMLGAVFLCQSAQAVGTLDQSVEPSSGAYYPSYTGQLMGQSFTAGMSGELSHVELSVTVPATPSVPFTLSLYQSVAGLPTGSALASVSVPASSFAVTTNITPTWVDFVFQAPASVTAGTQYVLVESLGGSGQYSIYQGVAGYSGGAAIADMGAGWVIDPTSDLMFRTYVTPSSSSGATPPPVLQQFESAPTTSRASLGCDASASSSLNWGGANSGSWGDSWAQWANGGKGGAVCTRTLVYSNALGHWIVG